ncbi:hypothetical protein OAJ74_05160 [Alphaproteobacteria bacterium]|nr:hypothetical protein [Alphaproteobacteria bacterium]
MNINKYKKVFICATEQSGDNIGSCIINEILLKNKNVKFDGVGGSKISHFLENQYFSLHDFKSIGIFEIILSIKKYIKMIIFLSKKIIANNYDLIITIDSPDFNYPLIKRIRKKKYNKKVIQIVAPTVWAWREYRAKKFSKVFDEIFLLFNFEDSYFSKYGLKTTFIGHPIFYIHNIKKKIIANNIAFLPGSRIGEVKKLSPFFQIAYEQLLIFNPNIIIFIPTLPHLKKLISEYVSKWKIKTIITTDKILIEKYYSNSKFALVCSGTASLEIAKREIPQLIIYKINFFTEIILKMFVKIRYANIINIIADKIIIPELTNSKLNKRIFIKNFVKLITDLDSNKKQIFQIKRFLNQIETKQPPFTVAAKKIEEYLR